MLLTYEGGIVGNAVQLRIECARIVLVREFHIGKVAAETRMAKGVSLEPACHAVVPTQIFQPVPLSWA